MLWRRGIVTLERRGCVRYDRTPLRPRRLCLDPSWMVCLVYIGPLKYLI
jgi:hypothetical protein